MGQGADLQLQQQHHTYFFFYFQNAIEDRGNYVFSYVDSLLVPLPFVKVLHSSLARIIPTDRSHQTPLKKRDRLPEKKVLGKNKCDFVIRGPCITWYVLTSGTTCIKNENSLLLYHGPTIEVLLVITNLWHYGK